MVDPTLQKGSALILFLNLLQMDDVLDRGSE